MKNRNIILLMIAVIVSFVIALIIILPIDLRIQYSKSKTEYKDKEIINRLLAVPIVLYHHIGGKGVYSVSEKQLVDHFELIKNLDITVIPLKTLISHLRLRQMFKKNVMVITFDDGFNSAFTKLLPLVKKYNYPVTLFVYTDFIKKRSRSSLTWKKLQVLEKNNIDIQCHSKSHADLRRLCKNENRCFINRRAIYREMYLAKRTIENYLNKDIEYFAFPYGRYNPTLIELAKQAGYKRVFSTMFGSNIVTRDNYCLKRHHIKNSYTLKKYKRIITKMLH